MRRWTASNRCRPDIPVSVSRPRGRLGKNILFRIILSPPDPLSAPDHVDPDLPCHTSPGHFKPVLSPSRLVIPRLPCQSNPGHSDPNLTHPCRPCPAGPAPTYLASRIRLLRHILWFQAAFSGFRLKPSKEFFCFTIVGFRSL